MALFLGVGLRLASADFAASLFDRIFICFGIAFLAYGCGFCGVGFGFFMREIWLDEFLGV